MRRHQPERAGAAFAAAAETASPEENPALLRLKALAERDVPSTERAGLPVDVARPNWTPLGPLAVPNGQTYGGARILISGRVTAIASHPTDAATIFIGTSRGGVWRSRDGGDTWVALGDNQPSLAIGALGIGTSNPDVLYAGTGEGNVQLYSTAFALSSAPGVYLGVGVLRSTNGGDSWAHQAVALLANHSFYRIVVDRTNADRAFAATSRGLCRTTDGSNWTALSGSGLPAISSTVIACTDVLIDRSDATGNTVYAAFWQSGIYKSTNALAATPTFTPLTTGLPAGASTSRISLKQSASSPAHKYALVASSADAFLGLYRTTNVAGTSWELCTNSATVQVYGAFTSDVNVDPTTPDVVYLSGVELYKCQRNTVSGVWAVTNVGHNIHADSHAFAFHPTLNQTIYSGNDGGFFISRNGGTTWDDSANEGLCLMQYEAIDNHPSSDALVQGGTQDNGTQQFRNSPVHYHSADGDGGYCTVSKVNGNHVTHAYYSNSPERSTAAGKFGSYANVAGGLNGSGLFYPPAAISPTSERMAWATQVINFDDAMGTGGWPGSGIALPGLVGSVSAASFASATLFYCATTSGQVYRLDQVGATWNVRALHAAPLPTGQWIWDVQSLPGAPDTVVVAFSGFGLAQHVWRGTVPAAGTATWTAVSSGLPDVPMYALAFGSATQWFVGTDIGVFRSVDAGGTWSNFTQGLPNTAIYDLRLRPGSNLLRAATHGRGLWELRTDVASQPTVDIFVRDHIMDAGRPPSSAPVAAAWDDPTRTIALNDTCYWWHCADIKTDAPPTWQLLPAEVNYLNFETRLVHENPEIGNQNRVYVQVHNRGPLAASNVTVKIMTVGASAGLPDLPADFWSAWPNSAGDANWTPVGTPQTIAVLDALRPTVLQWSWTPPPGADAHTCMLAVIDSPSDPVPAATKAIFSIATLVTTEKRCGLKNLHLVNLLPNAIRPVPFHLHGARDFKSAYVFRIPPLAHPQVKVSLLLSKAAIEQLGAELPAGLKVAKLAATDLARLREYWAKVEMRGDDWIERVLKSFDTTQQFSIDAQGKGVEMPVAIKPGAREDVMLLLRSGAVDPGKGEVLASWTLQQTTDKGEVVGGSTFVFRAAKPR
ncbi:MAG: WD40/YVTN/BNR-like repeat-containing protein [Rhizobacter sp.]